MHLRGTLPRRTFLDYGPQPFPKLDSDPNWWTGRKRFLPASGPLPIGSRLFVVNLRVRLLALAIGAVTGKDVSICR